jgi:hypothetical protein
VNELGLALKDKLMVEGSHRKGGHGSFENYFLWVKTPGGGNYSSENYQVNYYPERQEISIYDNRYSSACI